MDRVFSEEAYRMAQVAAIATSATPSDWDPTAADAIDWAYDLVSAAEDALNHDRKAAAK